LLIIPNNPLDTVIINRARWALDLILLTTELVRSATETILGATDIQRTLSALGPVKTPASIAFGFQSAAVQTALVFGTVIFAETTVAVLGAAADLAGYAGTALTTST
jgi:hypothetical protein